ncbi:MAG: hypothetical protein BGN96_17735 [Bacteroidales bacterium 45-6]|nr:MAG: hypothetical protein BGN96_17735 [Bacteroidales bacterium 45-6]
MKYLSFGYTFNNSLLGPNISKLRVFLTFQNLITITKYSGFDPEVSLYGRSGSSEKNIAPGIDYGTYPQSRDFIIGLNITF